MDITTVYDLVCNVAFPIAAFILMVVLNREMSKEHKEEVSKLSDVIAANTTATERMVTKLEDISMLGKM